MSPLKPLRLSIVFSGDKGLRMVEGCLPSSNRLLVSNVQVCIWNISAASVLSCSGRNRIGYNAMVVTKCVSCLSLISCVGFVGFVFRLNRFELPSNRLRFIYRFECLCFNLFTSFY